MSTKTSPLTAAHARVLAAMIDAHGPATTATLSAANGMGRTYFERTLNDLVRLTMATATEPDQRQGAGRGRIAKLWAITRNGRRALARHEQVADDAQRQVVPPARINLFKQPGLEPVPSAYYRNNGNTHIPSHGVRC